MCGIVGAINWQGKRIDAAVMERMTGVIDHRGPDDHRVWVAEGVGLGHQRLSIIDLTDSAAQPMVSDDGRYRIVFNGEIYNYQELKDKYCKGVNFRSTSDTEVLLYLLIKYKTEIFPALRGMFAFALWDGKRRELLLARDSFGKKPLYIWHDKREFVFASEIKALLKYPSVKPLINKRDVVSYLIYEYVPEPATGFVGIRQLPMGCYAEVSKGRMKINRWWKPQFQPKKQMSEKEAMEEFDGLMQQAVKRRLVADVPVGLLLSGGIDSTAVGWYMKQASQEELHSFSVGFRENTFNEDGYAQQAASVLGTNHHHCEFGIDEFKHYLSYAVKMDIPFGDSSLLPTWAVSDLAHQHVKGVLDGDGSDELLGGYGIFAAVEWADKLSGVPVGWWRVLESISHFLPTGYEYFTWDFKLKSFLRGMGMERAQRQQAWLGSYSLRELQAWLTDEYVLLAEGEWRQIGARMEEAAKLDSFDGMSAQIINDYLQNDILVKLDRASMTFGLEARTPFLDTDLAEFIMRLPAEYKQDKKLLRKVMRGRIPDSIIDRPKQGFALPLGHWLRNELYDWTEKVLESASVDEIFKAGVVKRILHEHRSGRVDHRKKIWTMLALALWRKQIMR
jgi:asparagine synthase (glutamine-hydrolysing)